MIHLSVVIPCYNEEKNIPDLLKKIKQMQQYKDIEFILVENGSVDHSRELIASLICDETNVRMICVNHNQGYGYGIKKGLKACQGNFIGWTHADAQMDVCDILIAYHFLKKSGWEQENFFKGIRSPQNRSLTERFLTKSMGTALTLILKYNMYDINGQPNIYPEKMRDILLAGPDDVLIEVYAYYMALKNGFRQKRKIVGFGKRIHGKSRLLPNVSVKFETVLKTIRYAKALKDRHEV